MTPAARTIIAVRFLVPGEFQNHRVRPRKAIKSVYQAVSSSYIWSESVINKLKTNICKNAQLQIEIVKYM